MAVVLGGLALVSCSADTKPLPTIISTDEPGPRLTVEGRVLDAATGEPVEGARLVVYQTDQAGTYQNEDSADESTAVIRAELTSGSNGEFGFVTVQPGEYPDQPPGNRHIHFHSVTAPGYASKGFVLLFDDNVRADVRELGRIHWLRHRGARDRQPRQRLRHHDRDPARSRGVAVTH